MTVLLRVFTNRQAKCDAQQRFRTRDEAMGHIDDYSSLAGILLPFAGDTDEEAERYAIFLPWAQVQLVDVIESPNRAGEDGDIMEEEEPQ